MHIERARFLASPRGRESLAGVPDTIRGLDPLRLTTTLRKTMPGAEAAAIAEQITLRARHASRTRTNDWLLTAEGAEMMTRPEVADRRAARLAQTGLPVVDGTCGLGGDLGALLAAGIQAMGVERDAATALLAAANCDGRAVRGDALNLPAVSARVGLLIDPARRTTGGRQFRPEAFSPSWNDVVALARGAAVAAVKGPPGVDHALLPADAEVEWIQLGRSLREATLWFGDGSAPGLRRAVHLPSGAVLDSGAPQRDDMNAQAGMFIIDPESCITRSGLVRHLAAHLDAWRLDEHLAYLSSNSLRPTPLATAFEVLDVVPFSVNALKRLLRRRRWRPDEIRRRAFPVEPDELRRLLGAMEGEGVTLVCTTIGRQRTVFVGRRVTGEGQAG